MAVAVVITNEHEAPALTGWAWQCARARGEDVVVLATVPKDSDDSAQPLPTIRAAVSDHTDAHARLAAATAEAEGASPEEAEPCPKGEVVPVPSGKDEARAVLAALTEHGAKLLIVAKHTKVKGNDDVLSLKLFREAACMVMLLRLGKDSTGATCRRVLVPTAGGPHATEAIRLASKMTGLADPSCAIDKAGVAGVDALYVEPDIGPDAELVGKKILDKAIRRAAEDPAKAHVRPIVEVANDVRTGLAKVVETGAYDLVLVGAANQWYARKALFGMIPDKLLDEDSTLTVGVVRMGKPLMTAVAEKVRHLLARGIPQINREDRVSLV